MREAHVVEMAQQGRGAAEPWRGRAGWRAPPPVSTHTETGRPSARLARWQLHVPTHPIRPGQRSLPSSTSRPHGAQVIDHSGKKSLSSPSLSSTLGPAVVGASSAALWPLCSTPSSSRRKTPASTSTQRASCPFPKRMLMPLRPSGWRFRACTCSLRRSSPSSERATLTALSRLPAREAMASASWSPLPSPTTAAESRGRSRWARSASGRWSGTAPLARTLPPSRRSCCAPETPRPWTA
mmetsp:Transcript_4833/g.20714  ORF Transcript_4833/g.20714 Transcript_4833/m.20714 type:complete len:239 (+) Transcript_4833:699-1415(+)